MIRCSFFLVLLAASAAAGEPPEPEKTPQPPERFLRDWVRAEARYDHFAFFHEHASDVHRADSEHFEVGVKVLALRTGGAPEIRAALARALIRLAGAEDTPEEVGLRALYVLGRLAASQALPVLVEATRAPEPARRAIAVRSLGFFGTRPSEESFVVYGGRVRYVVLPAAPSETATRALLAVADALPRTSPAGRGYGRGPFRSPGPSLALALTEALEAHPSAATAVTVAGLLRDPGVRSFEDELVTLLARCVPQAGLEILRGLAGDADERLRRLAARGLGRSACREAVAVLLALLEDSSPAVRRAAHLALTRLKGRAEAPEDGSRAAWTERLGARGERFDPAKARRLRQLEPGIYRLGS